MIAIDVGLVAGSSLSVEFCRCDIFTMTALETVVLREKQWTRFAPGLLDPHATYYFKFYPTNPDVLVDIRVRVN